MLEKRRSNPHEKIWDEAQKRVETVVKRKYPDSDVDKLSEIAQTRLEELREAPELTFHQSTIDGGSYNTVGTPASETIGAEIPVQDLVDYLGLGDSHEFEFGSPDPGINEWYLQELANVMHKPLTAYVEGQPIIRIEPTALSEAA